MSNTKTTEVAVDAFEAYRKANDLHPAPDLTYEEAKRHCNGDILADFLVLELTEGIRDDGDIEEQYYRSVDLIERAIGDLEHVRRCLINEQQERQELQDGTD